MIAASQRFQPFAEITACLFCEAGAHVVDVGQRPGVGVVRAQHQAADRAGQPVLARPEAADDDVLGLDQGMLEPGVGAPARRVRSGPHFRDESFLPVAREEDLVFTAEEVVTRVEEIGDLFESLSQNRVALPRT
ncbi:hypothetical protein [Kutzneria kofuensis]|uniref:Uncharacterized protein n=1 Tax=Kutzneria kofuensis TaxID=103725 RepID=A0A7W9NFH3_9PSEU|nr:hypothetical protein [Kutzneria kofuensis]MBB5891397.1 hypothetical protein [Kutzneria kofuensis]